MKHPHAEILKAFAEDTNVEIECAEKHGGVWCAANIETVICEIKGFDFRLKPAMRSITLQDGTLVEWPEPMRVAPGREQLFFVIDPSCNGGIATTYWRDLLWQQQAIKAGFCHLTEEAAQQHRRAIVLANGGEL